MGIAHVPEGRKLSALTVKENLEMGAYSRRAKPKLKANLEKMFSLSSSRTPNQMGFAFGQ
jgi:branched-chain amino acid transport system ATP-binding protein